MAAKRSQSKKKSPAKKKVPTNRAKATPRTPGRRSTGQDRIDQLERLIETMVAKDVVEVELEEAGTRWRVRRTEPQAIAYAAPAPVAMVPAPLAAGVPQPAAAGVPGAAASAEPQGEVFKSPMLGTFYSAPSPDAEVFVKQGDRVSADRTLCIIEAMKVMNEIKAEQELEIVEVLVKNGEPVEFGQPLFLIR